MSDELSNATRIAALEDYNQRLLAENVRLSNEAAEVRETLDSLRQSIYAACAGSGCLNAHELRVALDTARADLVREQRPWTVRLSIATVDGYEVCECTVADIGHADRILLVTCDDVTDMMQALDRERERCGVLEREVRAAREWINVHMSHYSHGQRSKNDHDAAEWLEEAAKETDTRHALDAAKFVGGG